MKDQIETVFKTARVDEIIARGDADKLLHIVMVLTGGWANPATVRSHIERIKTRKEGAPA